MYQHSEVFAKLKNANEVVKENYTTYQWLTCLDHFIESAIDPIASAYPDLMDNYFAKVVGLQTTKPSIKFSRSKKDILPSLLFNSLTTEGQEKRKYQKLMFLNRGVLFGLISVYLQTVNNYMRLHDPSMKISKSERLLKIHLLESQFGSQHVHSATLQVKYWSDKAHEFKSLIFQKYVRLALMNAKRTYTEINHAVKFDDVIQTYLVYLSKAIDRCDARQGVLTTFIQTWFYSARSETTKGIEHHSSYDELVENGELKEATQPDNSFEALQHISAAAKAIDHSGVIRFSLSIPEFFTNADLQVISTHQ